MPLGFFLNFQSEKQREATAFSTKPKIGKSFPQFIHNFILWKVKTRAISSLFRSQIVDKLKTRLFLMKTIVENALILCRKNRLCPKQSLNSRRSGTVRCNVSRKTWTTTTSTTPFSVAATSTPSKGIPWWSSSTRSSPRWF